MVVVEVGVVVGVVVAVEVVVGVVVAVEVVVGVGVAVVVAVVVGVGVAVVVAVAVGVGVGVEVDIIVEGNMKRYLLAAFASLLFAGAAQPATTSAQLFILATKVEEAPARDYLLERQGLALLAEPVRTYNQKTLPSYPGSYMANPETALTLTLPPQYFPASMQMSNTFYLASIIKWPTDGQAFVMYETGASSRFGRGAAMYAALLRSWAEQLKADGR